MSTSTFEQAIRTLEIRKEKQIAAPVEIVFETLLEHLGPYNETGPGSPLPMKLEPWPGGRWYRDLGNGAGHFWGHVQVIKPPTLLEICGPTCMSYPAISHIQYRLRAEDATTVLSLCHRAIGQISDEHRDTMPGGWAHELSKIREAAERRAGKGRAS
ncbi:MAG: SRPBCC domain-containing protein [Planctomycetia bacterium]|nr:SRPBCC domain-containing protein [Planctomycetia bacterium]